MTPDELEHLQRKLNDEVACRPPGTRVAIVGWSGHAFEIAAMSVFVVGAAKLIGIFAPRPGETVRPLNALADESPDIVVIAQDTEKESLLEAIASLLAPTTRIVIGGYGHFKFDDAIFDRIQRDCLIPSLANGYPHCLIHIYQCLVNAHRRGLKGAVAEFGMFKGGTTMLISRFIEAIGASWKVYGFDSFSGFPARRSPLDMYEHPDCVFLDSALVRAMFASRNVEIIEGDIVDTVLCIKDEDLVLSFVDTDNYTSAQAILDIVAEKTLIGGTIIFDHWANGGRFIDTIGERIAAKRLVSDFRYFNLHGTGVFLRQQ